MKTKKWLTSLLCVIGMSATVIPPAVTAAESQTLLFGNEIFAEGNFTIYDEAEAPGTISEVWDNFGIEATMNSDWNDKNGVKTDITKYVAGNSGKTFTLSAQAQNWAWDGDSGVNKVRAFFKVVSQGGNENEVEIYNGPDSKDAVNGDSIVTVNGSAALTFNSTDTVYLCFVHGAGKQQYKEMSLSVSGGSVKPPVETNPPSGDGTVLFGNEIFAAGNFTIYDEAEAPGTITQVWDNFGIEATMNNDWNDNNGVKTDITKYVAGNSGKTFTLSAQAQNWAWNGDSGVNKVRAFFKVVSQDGSEREVEIYNGPDSEDAVNSDSIVTINGSAALTFNSTDTVYLCFVHGAGIQQYKEISLSVSGGSVKPPVETNPPSGDGTVLFGNEIFAAGNFTIYDEAEAPGTISEVWDNFGIEAKMNNDWNDNNGVKTDITKYVAGNSGKTFTLSVQAQNWAWNGDSGVNKVRAFFKVVSQSGSENEVEIYNGPDSEDAIDDEGIVTINGSAALTFNSTDTVYLCFVHGAGIQQYKEISLSVSGGSVKPPVETDPPSGDGTVLFGNEIFAAGNFTIYDEAEAPGTISEVWDNFGIEATMNNDWNDNNGVKTDITKYVAGNSGKTFTLSVQAQNWAWNGDSGVNKVRAFFKVVSQSGIENEVEIYNGPDSEDAIDEEGIVTINGSAALTFNSTDTVYLCFVHGAGIQQYKEISLSVSGGSVKPPVGSVSVEAPALGSDGAYYVKISNTTASAADIDIYTSGGSFTLNSITVEAGTENQSVKIPASAGSAVFVWTDKMTPLINKTVLQ